MADRRAWEEIEQGLRGKLAKVGQEGEQLASELRAEKEEMGETMTKETEKTRGQLREVRHTTAKPP
jgi:hypothetical protein